MRRRVLVFPCGSEVGLEINRSVAPSSHFQLIGASSVDDHGAFAYTEYVGGVPMFDAPQFVQHLVKLMDQLQVDAVYPTMDSVIAGMAAQRNHFGGRLVAPSTSAVETCLSKRRSYELLGSVVRVPYLYDDPDAAPSYPIFVKPDTGYSGRGAFLARNREEAIVRAASLRDPLFLEYLPGREYTVDCFTNRQAELIFCAARERDRVRNGISVRARTMHEDQTRFKDWALAINKSMELRGGWFFQIKEDSSGELVLLEVAARIAGSSGFTRLSGINLPLMTLFDHFRVPVEPLYQKLDYQMDRALASRYKLRYEIRRVYVDLDDCLVRACKVDPALIAAIYRLIGEGIPVLLLTRHAGDLSLTLEKYRLSLVFDEIIHVPPDAQKASVIDPEGAIFIDDSFAERKAVAEHHGIPVFAPDIVESLF